MLTPASDNASDAGVLMIVVDWIATAPAWGIILLRMQTLIQSAMPAWVILFLGLTAVLIIYTMLQHRRHMRNTATRLCTGCGTSHPGFAKFCRHCGKTL